MKIFIASFATETNTFSPLRTDFSDFQDAFYAPPGQHPETPTLCSAIYPVCRRRAKAEGWELIEGTATWAEPGGIVNDATYQHLKQEIIDQLTAALPVDAVILGLHGAMVSQQVQDCEGDLLAAVREKVGRDCVIGATLDPHSHLSQQRMDNADMMIAFKEFPHTDFVLAAENCVDLVIKTVQGKIQPTKAQFDCRMIEIFPTDQKLMRDFIDRIKRLEQQDNILSISIIHGFMAGDVPDLGAKVLVMTDNDLPLAKTLAQQLGMQLFAMRGLTRPKFYTPPEAIQLLEQAPQAINKPNKPVIMADVWDNPGGGTSGDSTLLLQQLIASSIRNFALATIWDPLAVKLCFAAGENAVLPLRFGGKTAAHSGQPLDAIVTVKRLQKAAWQSFGASKVPLGDVAVIAFDGIEVILNSNRCQAFEPDIFTNLGIDPLQKTLLVLKSTNHFYGGFAPIAAKILYVEVDGPYPNNPKTNLYQHLKRPIWPRQENPHEPAQTTE